MLRTGTAALSLLLAASVGGCFQRGSPAEAFPEPAASAHRRLSANRAARTDLARLADALDALEATTGDASPEATLIAADALLVRTTAPAAWKTRLRALELRGEASLALGEPERAVEAYRQARDTLARSRVRASGTDFAARARPPLLRLADLLLRDTADRANPARLAEAVEALEDLNRAELRDYLGDGCLSNLEPETPDRLPDANLLYPIILPDRTEIITIRDGHYARRTLALSEDALEEKSLAFRRSLQDPTTPRYQTTGAELYDLLVRPDADRLIEPGRTLVWVATGPLRAIPLAALYDAEAKAFLIEQTPVATLPTLRVAPAAPIDPNRARVLALGLSKAKEDFAPLPAVAQEIGAISNAFEGRTRMNEAFTPARLAADLDARPFDIIHIASHGRFTEHAEDRFLLTAGGRMSFDRLGELIAQARFRTARPIELLTLSACETAIGDDRATLGLGGLAVEMGARSAVATLWQVNDASTAELFEVFYARLAAPGGSRAEALRTAQRALLEQRRSRHPRYWAPFLLINGWR